MEINQIEKRFSYIGISQTYHFKSVFGHVISQVKCAFLNKFTESVPLESALQKKKN